MVFVGSTYFRDVRLLELAREGSFEGRPVVARRSLRIPEIKPIRYESIVRRPLEGSRADFFSPPEIAADHAGLVRHRMVPFGSVELTDGAKRGNHPLRALLVYSGDHRSCVRRQWRADDDNVIRRRRRGPLTLPVSRYELTVHHRISRPDKTR